MTAHSSFRVEKDLGSFLRNGSRQDLFTMLRDLLPATMTWRAAMGPEKHWRGTGIPGSLMTIGDGFHREVLTPFGCRLVKEHLPSTFKQWITWQR